MLHSSALRFSEHQRPFCLLVALAVMLLVSVSVTVAHAASPPRLIATMQRDLGALRAQLEQIDPWQGESGNQSVAFNADLGDGGPAFRRLSMVTVVRVASRHLEGLIEAYRAAGDAERMRVAETLRFGMYELSAQIDRLGRPATPATTLALRDQVAVLLDQLDQDLASLGPVRTTVLRGMPATEPAPAPPLP